jgi:hypothetical protein
VIPEIYILYELNSFRVLNLNFLPQDMREEKNRCEMGGGTKKIAKMGFITLKRFSLSLYLSLAHTQTYIHTRAA